MQTISVEKAIESPNDQSEQIYQRLFGRQPRGDVEADRYNGFVIWGDNEAKKIIGDGYWYGYIGNPAEDAPEDLANVLPENALGIFQGIRMKGRLYGKSEKTFEELEEKIKKVRLMGGPAAILVRDGILKKWFRGKVKEGSYRNELWDIGGTCIFIFVPTDNRRGFETECELSIVNIY